MRIPATLLAILLLAGALLAALPFGALADPFEDPDLEAGVEAPLFRLNDHEGQAVSLGAVGKGAWVVVAFYPKSDTPG
jgi:cytochrome oxidase Cu insertion factor (SCO1/SenC/PrrC family)